MISLSDFTRVWLQHEFPNGRSNLTDSALILVMKRVPVDADDEAVHKFMRLEWPGGVDRHICQKYADARKKILAAYTIFMERAVAPNRA